MKRLLYKAQGYQYIEFISHYIKALWIFGERILQEIRIVPEGSNTNEETENEKKSMF